MTSSNSNLLNAVSDGHRFGAEKEMYEAFEKWLNHLKSSDDFWITLPEWDEKYYDGVCNVMVSIPHIIDLIDNGEIEEDEHFEVKDVEQPYHGFQGYDEEAALEYLMDNLPEMTVNTPAAA